MRESVRQTLADYTAATDRFDLRALAACFCDEGVLEFTGGAERLTGPAQIKAGLGAAVTRPSTPGQPARRAPTHVRHHVSSIRFGSVANTRVEVSSYFAVHTDIGLDHWGRYRDVLVPLNGRWLFAHRRISVDAFAADSLMA
ncbi:nuclear transport factor 2 family protein [Mycobacterium intracellulare subsp. intracellulare]|uniref:Nuclear transport factor 2 family protein n=1 Tax=Mycobacterium intracellulare subsp. chimaera TaxID=222805 RepID=A0ABT7P6E7_MYCIT|nr:nuclear transport factor 2 family protein [Mycobacterium intracellulare]MCF1813598.1 nuclear transport factor 2 family protein [Mycobacterium intracellulare subsp. intracellulare]MDM3928865.1 nuclear transport factor 2 family protein [Mycobacterium intracellulare subsp. chimaera]MDS0335310.1 nuclear transport factor 2 family protein [Mycobacterium intracellulare]